MQRLCRNNDIGSVGVGLGCIVLGLGGSRGSGGKEVGTQP